MGPARVKPGEWITGFCGVLILVALFMPWYGEESALSSVGVLDMLLVVAGIGGVLIPCIVARSRYTNAPIAAEVLVLDLAVLTTIFLLLRLIWAPEGGLKAGFFVGLVGSLLLAVTGWKNIARES